MRILILTIAGTVLLLPAVVLVATIAAAISLARDEDEEEHDCGGTCPAHDVGPDDLEAVAEAVGVLVTAPLSWELAKTPQIRAMSLVNSAAWLATAREIDALPVFRGGAS